MKRTRIEERIACLCVNVRDDPRAQVFQYRLYEKLLIFGHLHAINSSLLVLEIFDLTPKEKRTEEENDAK